MTSFSARRLVPACILSAATVVALVAPGAAPRLRRTGRPQAGNGHLLEDRLFRHFAGQHCCRDRHESTEPLCGIRQ